MIQKTFTKKYFSIDSDCSIATFGLLTFPLLKSLKKITDVTRANTRHDRTAYDGHIRTDFTSLGKKVAIHPLKCVGAEIRIPLRTMPSFNLTTPLGIITLIYVSVCTHTDRYIYIQYLIYLSMCAFVCICVLVCEL